MKRIAEIRTISIALAATATVGLAAVASPALASKESSLDAQELVPAFGQVQAQGDVPADSVKRSRALSDLPIDTMRILKRSQKAEYYVSLGPNRSEICLIVVLKGSGENAASACTSRPEFNQSGLALHLWGEQSAANAKGAVAYLMPADVNLEALSGMSDSADSGLTVDTGRGLITSESSSNVPDKLELPRGKSKRAFTLNRLD